jgi:hypothetical protein
MPEVGLGQQAPMDGRAHQYFTCFFLALQVKNMQRLSFSLLRSSFARTVLLRHNNSCLLPKLLNMEPLRHTRSRSVSPAPQPHKKPRLHFDNPSVPGEGTQTEDITTGLPADTVTIELHATSESTIQEKPKSKSAKKKKRNVKHKPIEPYSSEDVIHRDVVALLGRGVVDDLIAGGKDWTSPFQIKEEVELTVSALSSNGERSIIQPLCSSA